MIRTLIGIVVLIVAILWLPLWVQLVLFAVFVVATPHPVWAIIPAIVSDALYAPGSALVLSHHWITIIVLAMVLIHYFVIRKLRIRPWYGLEA